MEKIQNVGYEYLIASEISLVSELVQQGTGSQLQLGSKLHGINVYRISFVAFASMMFNFSHSFYNSRTSKYAQLLRIVYLKSIQAFSLPIRGLKLRIETTSKNRAMLNKSQCNLFVVANLRSLRDARHGCLLLVALIF